MQKSWNYLNLIREGHLCTFMTSYQTAVQVSPVTGREGEKVRERDDKSAIVQEELTSLSTQRKWGKSVWVVHLCCLRKPKRRWTGGDKLHTHVNNSKSTVIHSFKSSVTVSQSFSHTSILTSTRTVGTSATLALRHNRRVRLLKDGVALRRSSLRPARNSWRVRQ